MSKVSIGEEEYETQICWRISSSIYGCMNWFWMLLMALMRRWLRSLELRIAKCHANIDWLRCSS